VAGLIPLMMSNKYSSFSEEFVRTQETDFSKILHSKSYFLIRDLPSETGRRLMQLELDKILARQGSSGLWSNSPSLTYDILFALVHIGAFNLLDPTKLANLSNTLEGKFDYHSLMIKKALLGQSSIRDIAEMRTLVEEILSQQEANGSWEDTVVATAYHIERLLNLGIAKDDPAMQKAASFLLDHLG